MSCPSAAAFGVAAAVLGHPLLGLGGRAVVDRDLVALVLEVARHGIAHDAEPQKGNLHVFRSR